MNRTLKNFLSFFLVSALTAVTVAVLSLVTQAKTDPAAEYSKTVRAQQTQQQEELITAAPEKDQVALFPAAAAFAAILAVPSLGVALWRRSEKKSGAGEEGAASVSHREMTVASARSRV